LKLNHLNFVILGDGKKQEGKYLNVNIEKILFNPYVSFRYFDIQLIVCLFYIRVIKILAFNLTCSALGARVGVL
jgi:hypothetical protein